MAKPEYKMKIRDLPTVERPRERLTKYGAEALSNAELLAIILRMGSRGETAVDVGNKLLKMYDGNLRELFTADVNELSKIKGLGFAKAVQLKACLELAKRIFEYKPEKNQVRSIQDVVNMLMPEFQFEKQEKLFAVFLGTKNYLIKRKLVSVGGIDVNVFKPKEILYMAVKENSSAIIIAHNHPSGDPEPSDDDIRITKKLVEAGKVIGIPVRDHIIIGDGCYISMKEKGII
jgi:DNA repair protein RadC